MLQGALKKKIDEITCAIKNTVNEVDILGVKHGVLGAALYLFHEGAFSGDGSSTNQANELIDYVFENINEVHKSHHPNMDLAELGWFLDYINRQGFTVTDHNASLTEIDELLYENMMTEAAKKDFDTTFGPIVNGFYFLNRYKSNPTLKYAVEDLIMVIHNNINSKESILNDPKTQLGISHGIAGIILFLIKCYEELFLPDVILPLIRILNDALWAQINSRKNRYIFPITFQTTGRYKSRLSCWSYADPGILYALDRAADLFSDNEAQEKIVMLLKRLAGYKEILFHKSVRPGDGGLWYGTSGHVLVYDFFYEKTQQPIFKDATNFWLEKTLLLGNSINAKKTGGYEAVFNFPQYYRSDLSILTGIYGIGLTLMSCLDARHRSFAEFIYMV